MEELSQVVITLRSENEQMINILLEKITRLSEQVTQVVHCSLNYESNLYFKFTSMQGKKSIYMMRDINIFLSFAILRVSRQPGVLNKPY